MKTVFILGAGASAEAKLPTGSELKTDIARALNITDDFGRPGKGDIKIAQALYSFANTAHPYSGNMERFWNAAQRICRAMPQAISIDSFIDSHSGDEEIELCGKLAI